MNLESYRHQVGGHSRLVKSGDATKLYKPLVENELWFYKKLACLDEDTEESSPWQTLKKFIPGYHGTVEFLQAVSKEHSGAVRNQEEEISYNSTVEYCNAQDICDTEDATFSKGGLDIATEGKSIYDKRNVEGLKSISATLRYRKEKSKGIALATPLASSDPLEVSSSNRAVTRHMYIVLDDLVHNFKKPCVIDIKMGQRQRKLGATQDKELRQLEKSITTTSSSLGFRLCGYQSYDKKHDKFCYRDKYWGRKIGKKQVLKAIRRWFWNGQELHEDLIVSLAEKLDVVYQCVSQLPHYRFWSSSLLWLYDGGLKDRESRLRSLDIRMIDFANLNFLPDNPTPDFEYLDALSNLRNILIMLAISIRRSGALWHYWRDMHAERSLLGSRWYSFYYKCFKNYNKMPTYLKSGSAIRFNVLGKRGLQFLPRRRNRCSSLYTVAEFSKSRFRRRPIPIKLRHLSNISMREMPCATSTFKEASSNEVRDKLAG